MAEAGSDDRVTLYVSWNGATEVASWQLLAGDEAYGRLSVALQARFRMEKLFNVSKGAFRPPPKVESAVARLVPLRESRPVIADDTRARYERGLLRITLRKASPPADKVLRL